MVIGPGQRRHIEVVSGEKLVRLINKIMPSCPIFCDMVLNLIHVDIRHPAVNVHDSQEEVLGWEIEFFELCGHLFGAPVDVGPFALVLIFPQLMRSIVDLSEFRLELIDQFLSLDIRPLLMFFHRQIHKVHLLSPFMSCHNSKRFSQHLNILLVIGYDNRMQDLLSYLVSYL